MRRIHNLEGGSNKLLDSASGQNQKPDLDPKSGPENHQFSRLVKCISTVCTGKQNEQNVSTVIHFSNVLKILVYYTVIYPFGSNSKLVTFEYDI